MNSLIKQMLSKYEIKNITDEINALKEIIQELVLSGLSRSNFFNEAAFYGGTALRIFYNLDRFSEDLDFSLLKPNSKFELNAFFPYIKEELESYGLNMEISTKIKNVDSNIKSAFLKGDTLEHILKFYPNSENRSYEQLLKKIKIKFEIDTNPAMGATYDEKYKLLPKPHQIRVYDKESLFAGKIHAILCRNWKLRTKGRDLYDYIFFISNGVKINMTLIKNKLVESNFISVVDDFNLTILKEMLIKKFFEINYDEAKEDVLPFIKNSDSLNLWNKDFFVNITNDLEKI